jgi:hypothetical protein
VFQAVGYYQKTWTGKARGNLVRQVPLIASGFPEIRDYYPATINVSFEPKIVVAGWDHRTPPIPWEGGDDGEVFDLVRVRLVFEELDVRVRALWYVAHWSVHRNDPHRHEFLAEQFVPGLREGMPVKLEGDRDAIELSYTESVPGDDGRPRLARTLIIL